MAGRQSRADRLVPTFFIVASALACGEVASGEGDDAKDESTTAGSGAVTSNPPYPGSGGVGANPPYPYSGSGGVGGNPLDAGTSGAGGTIYVPGYGGAGGVNPGTGGFSNPPILVVPCPATLPVDDSSCSTGELFKRYPALCTYASAGCPNAQAACDPSIGKWRVEACDGGVGNSAGGAPADAGGAGGAGGAD